MNLYGYVGGDPVNRRDPSGTIGFGINLPGETNPYDNGGGCRSFIRCDTILPFPYNLSADEGDGDTITVTGRRPASGGGGGYVWTPHDDLAQSMSDARDRLARSQVADGLNVANQTKPVGKTPMAPARAGVNVTCYIACAGQGLQAIGQLNTNLGIGMMATGAIVAVGGFASGAEPVAVGGALAIETGSQAVAQGSILTLAGAALEATGGDAKGAIVRGLTRVANPFRGFGRIGGGGILSNRVNNGVDPTIFAKIPACGG
jgi:hypothetical protein